MQRRFTRYPKSQNSVLMTVAIMTAIVVAILVLKDDFASKFSSLFTGPPPEKATMQELPSSLTPIEREGEQGKEITGERHKAPEEAGTMPESSVGGVVNHALRQGSEIAMQAIAR